VTIVDICVLLGKRAANTKRAYYELKLRECLPQKVDTVKTEPFGSRYRDVNFLASYSSDGLVRGNITHAFV